MDSRAFRYDSGAPYMVPTLLCSLCTIFIVLGFPDPCKGTFVGHSMPKRWTTQSRHDNGSGCRNLVSCDRSRSAETSREQLLRQAIRVEDVVRPLAAWHRVLSGLRHFMLD